MAHSRSHGAFLEQSRRQLLKRVLIAVAGAATVAIAAVLLVPEEREHVRGHAYPVPSPDRRVTVEVLNGTTQAGVARSATRRLRRHGLDVVYFGNADATVDSTRVVVRRGDPARGRDVQQALGLGRILVEPDTLRRVDVSVILGRDFRDKGELHP